MPNEIVDKPKALFILHLPPPMYGATIANEYILNSAIINEKFETHFINLATNTKLLEVGKATVRKFFSFFSIFIKVIQVLTSKKVDVCYVSLTATGIAFYKDLLIITILKAFNVNILYFFHNKGIAIASKKTINHYLYKYAFHNTRSIILSKYLYPDIEKYVKEEDVFYCPYGIPITNTAEDNKNITRDADPCSLLFLGNMMVEKGVLILLEACKMLKEKNYNFCCHFVGGWTDISSEEFNSYILKYDLSNVVFVHGPKYNSEKLKFFKDSDIFIFPTYYHYETFGLVNLEAMQYGLPIISTPEGGIPDAVVHNVNGFLVPQHDVKALTERLEFLIKNPELRIKMGLAGKRRFNDLFTLDKFERNISNILNEAITKKQKHKAKNSGTNLLKKYKSMVEDIKAMF